MSKKILIVGTMRSGSSALAAVLKLLGFKLHDDLLAPNSLTKIGCHESKAATRLNDKILATLGSSWNSILPLPLGWKAHPHFRSWVAEAVELLRGVDVIKDPRLARLLPVWVEAAQDLTGEIPKIIITHRGLLPTVESTLKLAPAFSPNEALAFWGSVHSDLFHHLQPLPKNKIFVCRHWDLVRDWKSALVKMGIDTLPLCKTGQAQASRLLSGRSAAPTFNRIPEEVYDKHLLIAAGFLEEAILREAFTHFSFWRDTIKMSIGWSRAWAVGRVVPFDQDPEEEAEQRLREAMEEPSAVSTALTLLLGEGPSRLDT